MTVLVAHLHKIIDETLRVAWWRFVRLWRPMATWTLLTWVLLGLILVPLSSSVVGRLFFRGDRVIVGNEDLVEWLLRPEGLAYVVVAGALWITERSSPPRLSAQKRWPPLSPR